jgi:DNA-binding CsgD family transcriptional regulator
MTGAPLDQLHAMLLEAFAASREELPTAVGQCEALAGKLARTLADESTMWDEDLVHRSLIAIMLLDHLGATTAAAHLLSACTGADLDGQARFVNLGLLLRTRRGESYPPLPLLHDLPYEGSVLLRANLILSERYSPQSDGIGVAEIVSEFPGSTIARFALTSLVFDHAIYSVRLEDARTALTNLGQLGGQITAELGDDHPYLGQVLLTLAAAKCALAAVDGNIQDLRRYADVLAIAVQRVSAQLGPDHVHTIGGLANLAHIEFEIALTSRSPDEVAQCRDNLTRLERHSERVCGAEHPTVIVLAMNAAVAALESARLARSVEEIQDAEARLTRVARRTEERFGLYHPCTAIARSNAAAAGFDAARAERSRPGLEHMAGVLKDTVSQVSESLGAGHATARALTQQLRACRRLLASDNPWTADAGGTSTIVRTLEDEMWGLGDDYVPVYEASSPGPGRRPDDTEPAPAVIPVRTAEYDDVSRGWDMIERLRSANQPVRGTVVEVVENGLILDVGVRGFMPAQHVEQHPVRDLRVYLGRELEATVLGEDRSRDVVILSRRDWLTEIQRSGALREHRQAGPAKKLPERHVLTQREAEILRMVANGRTDATIGESLRLSRQGVFKSLTRIHDKLGLRGRANLRRYAIEQHLNADPPD